MLGKLELVSILSDARQNIVDDIGTEVNQIVKRLGMQIIDVRIRRADYPEATSQNIFNRMRSRENKKLRNLELKVLKKQKIRSDAKTNHFNCGS